MAVAKDIRQYIITYVKRRYQWQIEDLQKRVEKLEKTVDSLTHTVAHLQAKKRR